MGIEEKPVQMTKEQRQQYRDNFAAIDWSKDLSKEKEADNGRR